MLFGNFGLMMNVIKEPDLDTFLTIPCLEGYTISDIFANELYDEKSLYIF